MDGGDLVRLSHRRDRDSVDGTLARVRAIERPPYGYYLDHMIDAFNTAAVGGGIGLSPFVALE